MNLGVQGDKGNMKTNNNVMFFLFQRWNNKASKNWIVSFFTCKRYGTVRR